VGLTISEVDGRRGTARFVDVPWHLYGPADLWVPPLRLMVQDSLNRRGNPFYRDAERALFIATRDGRPVGRIAAIENRTHNRYHQDRVGFFGFFECADDAQAAAELLGAAEKWLAARGLSAARGPISPSMNHESGLLVDGFDTPPSVMTPWNPPYYDSLLKACGYGKIQDLLGYNIATDGPLERHERIERLAARTRLRTGVTFRTLDVSILEKEARKVLDLYCDAWSGNWGFTPPTWDDFWHTAKDLKSVLVPESSFVAEVDGEIVGFMLMARDLNRVLCDVPSGRLWPTTLFRLVTRLSKVRHTRIILLGLRAEYRNSGLFPLFAYEAARLSHQTGLGGVEASWVLDDNEALTAPLEAMGMQRSKRWRIYEKPLT
jgi:hypothetical protein